MSLKSRNQNKHRSEQMSLVHIKSSIFEFQDIAKVQTAEKSFETKIEDAFERLQGTFTAKVKQIETKCDESCSAKDALQPRSENSGSSTGMPISMAKLDTCRLICKPGHHGEQNCLIQDCGSSSELNGPCETNSHCDAGLECNVQSNVCVKVRCIVFQL